jgi:hypothetical protein
MRFVRVQKAFAMPQHVPEDHMEYKLSDTEQQVIEDLEWAGRAPEVQCHPGKLVVVRNKRVILVGTNQASLVARAAAQEQCPEEDLAVVLVPRSDVQEIPH